MSTKDLKKMPIPKYSKRQDSWNFITHFFGTIIAAVIFISFLILLITKKHTDVSDYVAIIFYGIALIAQFLISSIYHADTSISKKKQIKRLLDHLTIFVLIAGTYLPICIIGLKNTTEGLAMLISILLLMCIGIALNVWHMDKLLVRIITYFLYIVMGWMLICVPSAFKVLPFNCFLFVLLGGISYTVGAILYAIGHMKSQWFHVVFHVLIVVGAILQAIGIFYLL